MSGGSYGYSYRAVEDMAFELKRSSLPYRIAFANHLILVAAAMHDVEWVDSSDYGPGDDAEAIMKCINNLDVKNVIILECKRLIELLSKYNEETDDDSKRKD